MNGAPASILPPRPAILVALMAAAPRVPRPVWAKYLDAHGEEASEKLAADPAYLKLLDAVYTLNRSGGGLPELLDVLGEAVTARDGDFAAAAADWQEAISGELRVVDTGLDVGNWETIVTLPPRGLAGLHGETQRGEGGGAFGRQFDNWSSWSVRELLRLETGSAEGDPPQTCGWGDREGLHPSFTEGGGGNQITHFALALRLFAYHRVPYGALVGPVPPRQHLRRGPGRGRLRRRGDDHGRLLADERLRPAAGWPLQHAGGGHPPSRRDRAQGRAAQGTGRLPIVSSRGQALPPGFDSIPR